MDKICEIHGLTHHLKRSDRGWRCGKCATAAVIKRRKKIKTMAIEYKGGECAHCRGVFHPAVYEFHHIDPSKKDFAIGGGGVCRSWAAIQKELDKCDMLCANCHRIEHTRLEEFQQP